MNIPQVVGKLKSIIGDFYIVGGFCRRSLSGVENKSCDIDIVSPINDPQTVADMSKCVNWRGGMNSVNFRMDGRKINVLPMIGSLHGTLMKFDFTCCQVAFDCDGKTVMSANHAVDHIETKSLVPTDFLLNSNDRDLLNRSWARMAKLIREGYEISKDSLLAMTDNWAKVVIPWCGDGASEQSTPFDGDVILDTDKVEF